MTNKEIRQKAIECSKTSTTQRCCHPCIECEYGEYFCNRDVNCLIVCGYEHGFADGVEEGKRIALADLAEHGKEVVRKFAEWLAKSNYSNGYFDTENGFVSVDKVLAKYEKEMGENE